MWVAGEMTELLKIDVRQGDGKLASIGRRVVVHYTGWLYDEQLLDHRGRRFDSSYERGEPFDFELGAGYVIPGWDEGIHGMRVGGLRTLVVPPHLAYGEYGAGHVIPANAKLVFEVELLAVA